MSRAEAAPARAPWSGPAFLAHGFRPFFLFAGIWAVFALSLWLAALHGVALPEGKLPMVRWHAHEMAAGFIGAALTGFLLTAIPNWTGRRGYAGPPLLLLACTFVAARLALLPGSPLPPTVAAAIALLPLPLLLGIVLPALIAAKAPRLFGPPALVLAFWTGDLLMLGDMAGWFGDTFAAGQMLALNVALALVGLIGGRIVPSFTLNALRRQGTPVTLVPIPGVDRAGMAALLLVAVVDLAAPGSAAAGAVAGAAALLMLLRLSRWHGLRTLREPIVWVLHLAYLMIPLALATKAAWLLAGGGWAAQWLHLQTAGAIALMILAVMTRATLGHTGRDLVASRATTLAYGLVPLAALVRAFGDQVMPPTMAHAVAGSAWIAAFLIFLAVFGPMLTQPRADGKPG